MTRVLIGFFVAPVVPAVLLYIFNRFMGYGDSAIVGPFLLAPLGYFAAVMIGIPVFRFLQKRRIYCFSGYLLIGVAIGLIFYLLFTIITSYPGQILAVLQHSKGAVLMAATYSGVASGVFWVIAVRGNYSQHGKAD